MLTRDLEPDTEVEEEALCDETLAWESLVASMPPDPDERPRANKRNQTSLLERTIAILKDAAYIAYPATFSGETMAVVHNLRDGKAYRVSYKHGHCSCPAYRAGRDRLANGKTTCKHLEASGRLMEASVARIWDLAMGVRSQFPWSNNDCENYVLARRIDFYRLSPAKLFDFGSREYYLLTEYYEWSNRLSGAMNTAPEVLAALRERRMR